MEYRRNRRNEERGKDRRMAGDQNGEIDWLDEDSGTIKAKRKLGEKRSLPKPGPVMIALLAMLLLAGSTLTLVVLQVNGAGRQQEEQKRKDEQMARQLEEIQLYLASLDETVAGGQLSDEGSYAQLTQEVGTLQRNLTEYRDNNTIADDAIGEDLDSVIAQLDSIQENLEEEREAARKRDADGTTGNQQTAKQLQSNVDSQLSSVREDIRKLIQEASGESKAEYKELLTVLNGTDSELEALEKQIVSAQEKMQSALSNGLGNVNGNVTGLKGSIGEMKASVENMKGQQSELKLSMETQAKAQESALESLSVNLSDGQSKVKTRMEEAEESILKKLGDTEEKLKDRMNEHAEEEKQGSKENSENTKEILTKTKELQSWQETAGKNLDSVGQSLESMGKKLESMEKSLGKLTGDAGKDPEEEPKKHLHIDWDGNEVTAEQAAREGGCFHTPVYQMDESGQPAVGEDGQKVVIGYRASCRYAVSSGTGGTTGDAGTN